MTHQARNWMAPWQPITGEVYGHQAASILLTLATATAMLWWKRGQFRKGRCRLGSSERRRQHRPCAFLPTFRANLEAPPATGRISVNFPLHRFWQLTNPALMRKSLEAVHR